MKTFKRYLFWGVFAMRDALQCYLTIVAVALSTAIALAAIDTVQSKSDARTDSTASALYTLQACWQNQLLLAARADILRLTRSKISEGMEAVKLLRKRIDEQKAVYEAALANANAVCEGHCAELAEKDARIAVLVGALGAFVKATRSVEFQQAREMAARALEEVK